MLSNQNEVLENCRMLQEVLTNCSEIEKEKNDVLQEMMIVAEITRKFITENSQTTQNQDEYNIRYNDLLARYEEEEKKLKILQKQKEERLAKRELIGGFMAELSTHKKILTEFDEKLWVAVIDHATVFHDGNMVFHFKDGTEIEI
jgi:hypothetical protein